ncbi:hypothetical protein FOCC_FOCC014596, partial [Frankliniella occidentalis]
TSHELIGDQDNSRGSGCSTSSDDSELPSKRKKVDRDPLPSIAARHLEELDVKEVLESNESKGVPVLRFYEAFQFLKKKHRDNLVEIVVDALLKISHTMKNSDFEAVSKKIIKVFPAETVDIYYKPPKSESPNQLISSGRIPTRYRNTLQRRKVLAGVSTPRKPQAVPSQSGETPYQLVIKTANSPECKAAVSWLANSSDDWPLIKKYWKQSAPLRLKSNYTDKKYSAATYIENWAVLKHPSGFTLYEVDFSLLYPDKELSLFAVWDVFVENIFTLAERDVCDDVALQSLALARTAKHPNTKGVFLLTILPALCQPAGRSKTPASEKKQKLTIASARNALYLH